MLACLEKVAHRVHAQCDIRRSNPLVQLVEGVRPVGGIVPAKGVSAQPRYTSRHGLVCIDVTVLRPQVHGHVLVAPGNIYDILKQLHFHAEKLPWQPG